MSGAIQAAFAKNPFSETIHSIDRERMDQVARQSKGMKYADTRAMRKSGVFADYVAVVKRLEVIDALEVSNTKVSERINSQTAIITKFQEMVVDLKSQVMQYNVVTADIDIQDFATKNLRQIALTLNTIGSDGYEFGGATSDAAPIADIDAFAETTNIVNGKPTRNYTALVPSDAVSKIDLNRELAVGIDASHPAFQKMIAAMHMVRDLKPATPKDAIIKMLDEAIKSMGQLIVDVSFNDQILTDARSSVEVDNASASSELETKFKASVPELVDEAESIKSRLMFAISSLAHDTKRPKLLDFLR